MQLPRNAVGCLLVCLEIPSIYIFCRNCVNFGSIDHWESFPSLYIAYPIRENQVPEGWHIMCFGWNCRRTVAGNGLQLFNTEAFQADGVDFPRRFPGACQWNTGE